MDAGEARRQMALRVSYSFPAEWPSRLSSTSPRPPTPGCTPAFVKGNFLGFETFLVDMSPPGNPTFGFLCPLSPQEQSGPLVHGSLSETEQGIKVTLSALSSR